MTVPERDNGHEAAEADRDEMHAWAEKGDAALPKDKPRSVTFDNAFLVFGFDPDEFEAALDKLMPPEPVDYDRVDRNVRLMEIAYKNMPAPPADESPEEAAQDHCAYCGRAVFGGALTAPGTFSEGKVFRFAQDWHGGCLEDFLEEHDTES